VPVAGAGRGCEPVTGVGSHKKQVTEEDVAQRGSLGKGRKDRQSRVAPVTDWRSGDFICQTAQQALGGYAHVFQHGVGGLLVGTETQALQHVSCNC
jgi:hypothetical protein